MKIFSFVLPLLASPDSMRRDAQKQVSMTLMTFRLIAIDDSQICLQAIISLVYNSVQWCTVLLKIYIPLIIPFIPSEAV